MDERTFDELTFEEKMNDGMNDIEGKRKAVEELLDKLIDGTYSFI